MDNAAKTVDAEVATVNETTLSDEMVAEIIEREKYIEQHPNEWITAEESIKRLKNRHAQV